MEYTTLGRTGLRVSVMGLGCGGHSRLGLGRGSGEADAAAVVQRAIDLGVTFIDTAESYGTEASVGRGIAGMPRDRVVLSTKASVEWQGRPASASTMRERVEACLRRLGTDFVDVFHLHGVVEAEYDYAVRELVPALSAMRDAGMIRHLGITEAFASDTRHTMLARALDDDWFDVVMVGFNVLNQSARERVFTRTRERGVGTLCMFAVRRALSDPEALRAVVADLAQHGHIAPNEVDLDDPLGFMVAAGAAESVPEAAYRFCRHEPGLDVVLSGTGDLAHLEENARSIAGPPLPKDVHSRLRRVFARVDCVSGN